MKGDMVSRQKAVERLEEHRRIFCNNHLEFITLSAKDKARVDEIDNCIATLINLPSAKPEIKPIEYRDCANAMLMMWMDNVVTDGEYNRIMAKLNAYWRAENGRLDKQTGCD